MTIEKTNASQSGKLGGPSQQGKSKQTQSPQAKQALESLKQLQKRAANSNANQFQQLSQDAKQLIATVRQHAGNDQQLLKEGEEMFTKIIQVTKGLGTQGQQPQRREGR